MMSDSATPKSDSTFVCASIVRLIELRNQGLLAEGVRFACAGLPFYQEVDGDRYCVLHFPGKEKSADFGEALNKKLDNGDFNFSDVWFPDPLSFSQVEFSDDVDFGGATFYATADFTSATFSKRADFRQSHFQGKADFYRATFQAEADFNYANFYEVANFNGITFRGYTDFNGTPFVGDANFNGSEFIGEAHFRGTEFCAIAGFSWAKFEADASFSGATFRAEADFVQTTFALAADFSDTSFMAAANFRYASFSSYFKFIGDKGKPVFYQGTFLDLQFARIENPERCSFQTLRLHPCWFINIDCRRFEFINISWRLNIEQDITDLQERRVRQIAQWPLAVTLRFLAVNAEESHRYEEASKFRYMAMDVQRRERWRGLCFWRLSWWYWLASGYGERASQAFLILLGIILLSAFCYTHVGFKRSETKSVTERDLVNANQDNIGAPLGFGRALIYSAGVMILQKPEPRPVTSLAHTVVLLETVLGPVQAALLALAIRRKFMR